ncbi:MAG: hemolysin family protein [Propionibacteriaceae bacterium]|nr:hemolysin family protein [Propionibacteriaceae bacterium]
MALVSLRESQVRGLSTRGKRGRTVASLAADPNLFLSAVQIGVTLSGFLSAAFGGATLAGELAPVLVGWGVPEPMASTLALVVITVAISYVSIVVGELSAKRLAMQRAEVFAMALAPLVNVIAIVARPIIWFLGVSTNVVVRLLGGDPLASREEVTDEEIRAMVSSSATLGDEERQIVDEVFAAGQVSLREAMVPRTEVDFLDGDLPAYKAAREVANGSHSRYPVVGRDTDDVLGFLHVRDLFDLDPIARSAPISQLVRPVASLPQTVRILRALSIMQAANDHLVVVRDEYGGTAGIVTIEDLVEELIGDITDEFDLESSDGAGIADELDGLTTLEQFAERYDLVLPEGPYDTVAGYLMAALGHLPERGDSVRAPVMAVNAEEPGMEDVELTVIELDGRRASRLRLTRHGVPAVDSAAQ